MCVMFAGGAARAQDCPEGEECYDRPIVVRGGSVHLEFDAATFVGSSGHYYSANRQIDRITYQAPGLPARQVAVIGTVEITCANPAMTILIEQSGGGMSLNFNESEITGGNGVNVRSSAQGSMGVVKVGGVQKYAGPTGVVVIHTKPSLDRLIKKNK